jgi:hypothetical protein
MAQCGTARLIRRLSESSDSSEVFGEANMATWTKTEADAERNARRAAKMRARANT